MLSALWEVEDGLATRQGEHSRRRSLENAERSARAAAESTEAHYREGVAELQAALDARRYWHDARDNLIQSRLAWASAHVALFKALGGGRR